MLRAVLPPELALRTLEILGELASRARQPGDPVRAALLAGIAETSGLHRASLERLCDLWARAWMPPGPERLWQRGLGHLPADSFAPLDTVAVVAPGNLCVATWQAVLEPLLAGCRVRVRSGSGDPLAASNLATALGFLDADLAARIETSSFDRADRAGWARWLHGTDALAIYGGDQAIAAVLHLAGEAGYAGRVRCHGEMQSFAAIAVQALDTPGLWHALAHDALIADGRGCMSLRLVVLVGTLQPQQEREVHDALARALAEVAARLPAGSIAPQWRAAQTLAGDACEFAAALGQLDFTRGSDWWLASQWRPAGDRGVVAPTAAALGPGARSLVVRAVPDWPALAALLAPMRGHLSSAALLVADAPAAAHAACEQLGVHRLCAPGELQAPPAHRAPDGYQPLIDFVRVFDRE